MPSPRLKVLMLLGAALAFGAFLWFWSAGEAQAQCGSQASSCKNCHEVQRQMPVNDKGAWHTDHALSDACANCHGGNVQATDKEGAHAGMVEPLGDVVANCGLCHPGEETALGQKYADALGMKPGLRGGAGTPAANPTPAATAASGQTTTGSQPQPPAPSSGGGVVVGEPGVIDYNQRYDQAVSGMPIVNWGDVIVAGLIVLLVAGGGSFVVWNERRLRGLTGKPRAKPAAASAAPVALEDLPPDVAALLPALSKLGPAGLHGLKRLLERPDDANELLLSLSRLDPELLKRLRAVDRDSRALLLALAGRS